MTTQPNEHQKLHGVLSVWASLWSLWSKSGVSRYATTRVRGLEEAITRGLSAGEAPTDEDE